VSHPGRAVAADSGTSARKAERCAGLVAAAIRVVFVVQLLIGALGDTGTGIDPLPYWAITVAVLATSLVLIVQCVTQGRATPGVWHVPDLVLGFVAVPVLFAVIPAEDFVGTWVSWAVAYAINTAIVAATWLRPVHATLHAVTLGAWVALFSLMAAPETWRATVTNCLTIPGYAAVVAIFAYYMRALAHSADTSREEAIAATRALELHRYQRTVHDATSILRMLSDDDTPEAVLPGLRLQAEREATRLRNYLDPVRLPASSPETLTVGSMLSEALTGFDDLPLELAIDLGADAPLDEPIWTALRGAVTTALHNVRIHADARQVVVHADASEETWEVVVSDDGVGFDQSTRALGFGLSSQVQRALAERGANATVHSTPGEGTSVILSGPTATGATR